MNNFQLKHYYLTAILIWLVSLGINLTLAIKYSHPYVWILFGIGQLGLVAVMIASIVQINYERRRNENKNPVH